MDRGKKEVRGKVLLERSKIIMGRWVTSKGRRIYIPDEGEENPFSKENREKRTKEVKAYMEETGKGLPEAVEHYRYKHPDEEAARDKAKKQLKDQINKDNDTKEKQIANNKAQSQFGADMNTKISDYQNKFLKKRTDKELDEIENNLKKSTSLVGTSVNDQVALAAIENERKNRSRKKKKK